MLIGVLKEIMANENRVSVTPAGANELVLAGHEVFVQKEAGSGSGFTDDEYVSVGAEIVDTPEDLRKIRFDY